MEYIDRGAREEGREDMTFIDPIGELAFRGAATAAAAEEPSEVECEVLSLFDEFRNPLLRYALSFGLTVHDAEEVTQEVFLSLFRHLQLGRSRKNLRGWIYRVTHNLALRQRYANLSSLARTAADETVAELAPDPAPGPEEHVSAAQRRFQCAGI